MAALDLEIGSSSSSSSMPPKVIRFLSCLLQRVADSNDVMMTQFCGGGGGGGSMSIFHGLSRPNISIHSYLERIFKYANCSPSCFVVAYVYLDRFAQKQPSIPISSLNVHRLLITSVLVSAKFMDDIYYNNAYYAKVGGISREEMNLLEVDFLFGIGFELNVTPTTFHTYCSHLQAQMAILQSPPFPLQPSAARSSLSVHHCCYNEDDSTHQQQLAV
ncbi:unnamed protein product [Linum tenue]|uniref:Cyclin n=1 Tax=Linum tenue TaxID=586396 RepID=A0AAV0MWC0_9ROSI|nr:unnamed protein product [Linum tenue]